MTQHDPYTCLPLPQPFWVEPKTGYMSPSPCAEQHVLCADRAVLQLWLKESDEYEQLMGRTADPRLEKVLALIDKGVPPQTALNRHGNPVSLEHLCRDGTFCRMRWASSGVSVRTQLDEQASLAHGDGWIGHVGGLRSRETGQSASRGARCRPALHDGRRRIGPILN
jgi:hypothetical protein